MERLASARETARRVRIAVVDSGVDLGHPGVRGRIAAIHAVAVDARGAVTAEAAPRDGLGHGTAVTATMLSHVEAAELWVVRLFDAAAQCSAEQLAAAFDYLAEQPVDLVNASLGITDPAARACLAGAIERLRANGCRVLAPATAQGMPCLPGLLPGVDRVVADPRLRRGDLHSRRHEGLDYWFASPLPPTGLAGLPPHRIQGESLAVANATGLLAARLLASGA